MAIPFGKYTIKSNTGFYLSADGSGIAEATGGGAGNITCTRDGMNGESQQFFIIPVAEDSNIYTIQSVAYPGVYLRMDGSGITGFSSSGKGTVNLQYGVSNYEKFKIVFNAGKFRGMFSFESKAFPFVYLRTDSGKNIVNCQYGAQSCEVYTIAAVQ